VDVGKKKKGDKSGFLWFHPKNNGKIDLYSAGHPVLCTVEQSEGGILHFFIFGENEESLQKSACHSCDKILGHPWDRTTLSDIAVNTVFRS